MSITELTDSGSLQPFEQFLFRGSVELRHDLDRAALAE
jgi:hypothetical protein